MQLPESEIEAITSLPHLKELKSSDESDLKVIPICMLYTLCHFIVTTQDQYRSPINAD